MFIKEKENKMRNCRRDRCQLKKMYTLKNSSVQDISLYVSTCFIFHNFDICIKHLIPYDIIKKNKHFKTKGMTINLNNYTTINFTEVYARTTSTGNMNLSFAITINKY